MVQQQVGAKKRSREPFNIDTRLVEIYEDLASEKDDIRLKAAYELVSQFTADRGPSDEVVRKTLQRLFRGLCSSRKAARVGFSIALAEVLAQVFASGKYPQPGLDFPEVLDIWEAQSDASGSESGQVCALGDEDRFH